MPVVVQCNCGKKYRIGDDRAGRKLRCRECGGVIQIPVSKPTEEWDEFDDFGDDYGTVAAPPRKQSAAKSQRKSRNGQKKSAAAGGGMSPGVKFGIAGGIVVVTAGIVVGILMMRGIIGGGRDKAQANAESAENGYPTGSIQTGDGQLDSGEEATALAFSPNGKLLAVGLVAGGVQLWDMTTRKKHADVTGAFGTVNSLAFSPDGKTLAIGHTHRRGEVVLWDIVAGKMTRSLKGHTERVYAVAFSPDGKLLASGGKDRSVRLWDPATGETVRVMRGHKNDIRGLAFAPEGDVLVSGSGEFLKRSPGEVIIWNVETGNPHRTFQTRQSNDVAITPDGRHLVATDGQGLTVWSMATLQRLRQIKGHFGFEFDRIAVSPDGKRIAACGLAISTVVWDFETGEILKELPQMRSIAFSPQGGLFAGGDRRKRVQLIDVRNLKSNQQPRNRYPRKTVVAKRTTPPKRRRPVRRTMSPENRRAVAAIKRLGGKVTVDFWRVIRVDLSSASTKVIDASLMHLQGLTDLQRVDLSRTRITDAGLAHLTNLANLQQLDLAGTKVTGAGFAHLTRLKKLSRMELQSSSVNDSGLAHLTALPNLRYLFLNGTAVTDAGLQHLKSVKKLFYLDLSNTSTTRAGVRQLQSALRRCRIIWRAKPTYKTPAARNRAEAIAAIKKLRGRVKYDLRSPRRPVIEISLSRTKAADADLALLKHFPDLQTLYLAQTSIGDTGLSRLKGLARLHTLFLTNTKVTDAGLIHLKGLVNLKQLSLQGTQVTDSSLVHLKRLSKLQSLVLAGTKVTDAGLVHLQALRNLQRLFLVDTKVTAAGEKKLQAVLQACLIFR